MNAIVDAVVLSAEVSGDGDKRVTLFTREKGRVHASASSAARPGAKLAAATEPTARARFRLWLPENAVAGRVTGGSLVDGHPGLRSHWTRLTSALFFCEWTDRMTGLLHSAPEKFDLLVKAINGLEHHDPAVVRAAFLVQFARRAGVGPVPGVSAGDLDRWDFEGGLSFARAPAVEQQVIQFLAPLLSRPLRTLAQGRAMSLYKERSGAVLTR